MGVPYILITDNNYQSFVLDIIHYMKHGITYHAYIKLIIYDVIYYIIMVADIMILNIGIKNGLINGIHLVIKMYG